MSDAIRKAAEALVASMMDDGTQFSTARSGKAFCVLRTALVSPAPSTSRDDARDAALEEAARYFDGAEWEDPNEWFPPGHVAKWLRSLKGQPPPAAPADQSKETPHDP